MPGGPKQGLIDPQLGVLGHFAVGRRGLHILQVDGHRPAFPIYFNSVEEAAQVHPLGTTGRGRHLDKSLFEFFTCNQPTISAQVVHQETLQGLAGLGAFGGRLPGGFKPKIGPDPINQGVHAVDLRRDLILCDIVGDRMHHAAEFRGRRARGFGPGLVLEEPTQCAAIDGFKPLPDKVIGTPSARTGWAPSDFSPIAHHAPGLAAGTSGSPSSSVATAKAASFLVAAARSAGDAASSIATRRSRATNPSREAVNRGRPDLTSVATFKSATNRLGCRPESVPESIAVTTTRRRALVHAT